VTDILAAVLRADVEWEALPANTPSAIRRLLRRCLVKDRKNRLQAIGDARMEIEDCLAAPEAAVLPARRGVLTSPRFRKAD
jgi:eukaryotic-like serine/threonine-protein kinase